jgi:hypothetical protein
MRSLLNLRRRLLGNSWPFASPSCASFGRGRRLSHGSNTPNPAVDPVRFALWTLRDKAAQRRSPLRWRSLDPWPQSLP